MALGKELSTDQIQDILFRAKKEERVKIVWPGFEDRRIMLEAVRNAKKETFTVKLSDDHEYVIHVNPAESDLFYIKSAKGPSPCGWFRQSKLREQLEESEVVLSGEE